MMKRIDERLMEIKRKEVSVGVDVHIAPWKVTVIVTAISLIQT